MAHAEVSAELPVGAEEGWVAVVTWERQSEWMLLTKIHGGSGIGERVWARTAVGPLGFTDDMEITVWDPPRLCRVKHLGKVMRGEGAFAIEDLGPGRCRFVWSEDLELGPLEVAWPALRPGFELFLRLSLRRLVRRLGAA
jgi:hypothetical protein